ncbi:MAG: nickel-dependent lactate racemase [Synergistaceae bacterium]|jgi:nickel-dependent lactate racemase|nr:nickel-dependent lactate racemase [Synergistaceae bacterium]
MKVGIPYGKTTVSCEIPDARLRGVLYSRAHDYKAAGSEADQVRQALNAPVDSPSLRELSRGKRRVVIVTSDHTRPVPSAVTMPILLREIRAGNPEADITILVATGMHRNMTKDEIAVRFGAEIVSGEKIVVHDSRDDGELVSLGTLPSGGELLINRRAVDCDLLVAEGFIEPHFFAGFSGGRKAILPGIAGYPTVLANHCAEFISDERARTGVLDGNPIHRDMIFAARAAKLAFILNVVLDSDKKIIAAFAGDTDAAHRRGCDFLKSLAGVQSIPADIVITGNGGYPLDQNIYQAVKCMTGAEASINPGGVIIVASECSDGHGGAAFYDTFKDTRSPEEVMRVICARGRNETLPDQWQIQIFMRILMKHKVILAASVPPEMILHLGMTPAPGFPSSLDAALAAAGKLLGKDDASVTVIPDGVSVIVE